MNINSPGDIQFTTLPALSFNDVTFDLNASPRGVRLEVERNTFKGPVNVCFQEYTGVDLETYPQPFIDPAAIKPRFSASPIFPSGGWFLDFSDAETNIPEPDFHNPIVLSWKQLQRTTKKAIPYLWDEFSDQWQQPAFTIAHSKKVLLERNSKLKTVTFNVGALSGCGGQFQMYDIDIVVPSRTPPPIRTIRTTGTKATATKATATSKPPGTTGRVSRTTGTVRTTTPSQQTATTVIPSVQTTTTTEETSTPTIPSAIPSSKSVSTKGSISGGSSLVTSLLSTGLFIMLSMFCLF